MGRHGHGSKKPDPSTTQHEEDSALGHPGLMVEPGLGRDLGMVDWHGPDTILG
jgi:hypothetical protein